MTRYYAGVETVRFCHSRWLLWSSLTDPNRSTRDGWRSPNRHPSQNGQIRRQGHHLSILKGGRSTPDIGDCRPCWPTVSSPVSPTGHNYSLRSVDRMEQQLRNFVWHCDHGVVSGRELMIVVNASRLCGSRATSWPVTDAIDIGPRNDRS